MVFFYCFDFVIILFSIFLDFVKVKIYVNKFFFDIIFIFEGVIVICVDGIFYNGIFVIGVDGVYFKICKIMNFFFNVLEFEIFFFEIIF